jgi:uncharacterized protein YqgC (DUF456 family)
MATHIALWALAIALIAGGLVGTIVPALPGVLFMYAGMWLAAWIDAYARIGTPTLLILGLLTACTLLADLVASVLGAKRVGASRQAVIGSVVGGLVGIPFGLPGLCFGPFVGAVAGELWARRNVPQALHVGIGTWIGLLVGTLAKVALAVIMLAVFAVSWMT